VLPALPRCILVALLSAAPALATPPPWPRTEARADCAAHDPLRQPFFGDLHVHTSFSHDAYIRATRTDPRAAYRFARGDAVTLPDGSGALTRVVSIDRPLDFAAVTDHAEFIGETRSCITPGHPAFDTDMCQRLRALPQSEIERGTNFVLWGAPLGPFDPPDGHAFCDDPNVDCDAAANLVWHDIQAAADEAYDRTSACAFTTFVGYENTAAPGGRHLHRNVIFRNAEVPARPASYLETKQAGAPQPLWDALDADCRHADGACDALVIPHNSNLSGGGQFLDPADAADGLRRQQNEPLVELHQSKGNSECRFDRLAGRGVATVDELCTFEQDPRINQIQTRPVETYPARNLVRNVLKDGLAFADGIGANPFAFGFVGSTDTHVGTPGNTDERRSTGHEGYEDASPPERIRDEFDTNPGGLAVVWAEENSRDALFAALQRRETYATSGTRPVVRFFGGGLDGVECGAPDLVARSYDDGAPMGGQLGPLPGNAAPRFVVLAMKDPGAPGLPGSDLERLQIVKGWVDADGVTRETVVDVARASGEAGVDPATCEPTGGGAAELCAVWQDPDFDPRERAFYYARVVETPTCRWSTRVCRGEGVDPFAPDCAAQALAADPAGAFAACCSTEATHPFLAPTTRERAWTSPIWYDPDGIAALRATVRHGRTPGADTLKLALALGDPRRAFDPAADALTLRLTDDDEIWSAAIPAGTFVARGASKWTLGRGAVAGIRRASLRVRRDGSGRLKLTSGRRDLSAADASDHVVTLELIAGGRRLVHARPWSVRGRTLRRHEG